jgi:hypothetical protein
LRKRSGRPPKFAAVPNETVDDAVHLDLQALGLLTVMLRHQDGFDITLPEIAKKYGYGRDGLAGAMGLLQVAQYVVKVRIMWAKNNQWTTEVVVYDTPARDDEVTELLASIERERGVRQVKLDRPTKGAVERAAKRMAELGPAQAQRKKLDFAVPSRESAGAEGRSSRGRGGEDQVGGAGAAGPARQPARKAAAPKPKAKTSDKRPSRQQSAAMKTVEAAFPEPLCALLPSYRPPVLRDALLEALDSRSPEVLAERVLRRWWMHGYEKAAAPGGKGIGSAIGVAVALVRPSTDCPEPMCEDGVILDNGVPCRTCERRSGDRKAGRTGGAVPAQRGEPGGHGEGPEDDGWSPNPRWKCRNCRTLGKTGVEPPEDGLCRDCQSEVQEAAAAAGALQKSLQEREDRRAEEAASRRGALVEDAYAEHAERERLAAEDRARREAEAEREAREAEERHLLQEQIRREHPELAVYSQTG